MIRRRRRRVQSDGTGEVVHASPQAWSRQNLHPLHQRRLTCVLACDDQAPRAVGSEAPRHGEHTGYRAKAAVERQLGEEGRAAEVQLHAGRLENCERDG